MKEQENKLRILQKKLPNLIEIKIWKLSNNIFMSLFSNRETIKICASTIWNSINNHNLSITLDWKVILEFKQNNKNLEQNISMELMF